MHTVDARDARGTRGKVKGGHARIRGWPAPSSGVRGGEDHVKSQGEYEELIKNDARINGVRGRAPRPSVWSPRAETRTYRRENYERSKRRIKYSK